MRGVWLGMGLLGSVGALGALAWAQAHQPPPDPVVSPFAETRGPSPRATPPVGAPHVVFILGCTVRRDQLGLYGGPPGVSPFLDSLPAHGVVFDDLVVAAPWTRPAAAALLTGHHALHLGLVEPGPDRNERVLSEASTTLAERLHQGGWHTLGLTANPNLNAAYGFHQGFERYLGLEHLWSEAAVKLSGAEVVAHALRLVDEAPEGPLYLQVALVDAHGPHPHLQGAPHGELPEAVQRYQLALGVLDTSIRTLVEGLSDRGITEENTLFLFVSDHGEGLSWPASAGRAHGRYLGPSAARGAWVMWGAGVGEGHRVEGLVSGVDVAPTVAGLLGLKALGGGEAWTEQARGRRRRTTRDKAFVDTWFKNVSRAAIYTPTQACQVDFDPQDDPDRPGFPQGCFDRRLDPHHERPGPGALLLDEVRDWRRRTAAGISERAAPDPRRAEVLEALGYTEGG